MFLQSLHAFWNWLRSFQVNHIQPLGDASEQSAEYMHQSDPTRKQMTQANRKTLRKINKGTHTKV